MDELLTYVYFESAINFAVSIEDVVAHAHIKLGFDGDIFAPLKILKEDKS